MTDSSELTGGIKNALERGQSIESVKQSFINAGYKTEEVESASKEINIIPASINSPILQIPVPYSPTQSISQQSQPQPTQQYQPLPTLNIQAQQPADKPILLITLLIILSIIILAGAALLGIYWNNVSSFIGLS